MKLSSMKLNVMLERSSLSEAQKEEVRALMGNPSHPDYDTEATWAFLQMHQLMPCVEIDAFTQKEVNRRLDFVMLNERL